MKSKKKVAKKRVAKKSVRYKTKRKSPSIRKKKRASKTSIINTDDLP